MRFSHIRSFHTATRVEGPSRNFLGLTLEPKKASSPPTVLRLPGDGNPELDPSKVLENVVTGIEEANEALGTDIQVRQVQYDPGDSGPEEIYQSIAYAIVEDWKRQAPED